MNKPQSYLHRLVFRTMRDYTERTNQTHLIAGLLVFSILLLSISPAFSATDSLVYVIDIEGVIDMGLAPFIERAINEAEKHEAQAIVFDINTPGGRLDAAIIIRDAIFDTEIPTVAFVNREAASAGALISISCKTIVMAPGSSIGAATPVDLQGTKGSEKIVSYMRGIMRSLAERNGRDPKIAEAMVDEDVEIPGVIEEGKLLTLTAEEALKLKFIDHITEGLDNVLAVIGLPEARIVTPETSWSENFVRFLTHPIVSSLLMTIGMLGLIYEVMTQGWGIGGTVGLIALALFFGSNYLVNLANMVEILIFLIGAALLLIEIFFTPGFGLLGFMGIIAIIASLIMSLVGSLPTVTFPDIAKAVSSVAIAIALTIVFSIPALKLAPKTAFWQRLILSSQQKNVEGFRSSPAEYESLIGKTGTALTTLRPAGIALVNGQRLNVVAEGNFIEPNMPIKITKVEGNRIVVTEIS